MRSRRRNSSEKACTPAVAYGFVPIGKTISRLSGACFAQQFPEFGGPGQSRRARETLHLNMPRPLACSLSNVVIGGCLHGFSCTGIETPRGSGSRGGQAEVLRSSLGLAAAQVVDPSFGRAIPIKDLAVCEEQAKFVLSGF